MKIFKFISISFFVILFSCVDDITNLETETNLQEITSYTEGNLTVKLYATTDLFVGYNSITARVKDSQGNSIEGDISVVPMMDMMNKSHTCPLEIEDSVLKDGEYSFNTVFVMPSSEMGSWHLDFTINKTELSVPINVNQPELSRLVSFNSIMDENTKYFVAYIDPQKPDVGQNDLEIAVFKKQTLMDWPAVTSLSFEVEPWMTSMDHGSPNNTAPVHTSKGHYKGTVNFTMTGDWQLRLTMKEHDQVCGTPYFDLYFQ